MILRRLSFVLLLAVLGCPFGHRDPLLEGCRFAVGLTKQCDADDGAKWFAMPSGYTTEELTGVDSASLAITSEVQQLTAHLSPSAAQSRSIDAFDRLIASRYLLSYSERGAVADCVAPNSRGRALDIIMSTDGDHVPIYLQIGPPSTLTSKVFTSLFESADFKAQLDIALTQTLGDEVKGKAAANVAFNAMKRRSEHDVAVGIYRYITVRSFRQLWHQLDSLGFIDGQCKGRSIGIGVVVVAVEQRERVVEQLTGTDLRAALSGAVDSAQLDQVVVAAQASLNVEISKQSQRQFHVSLDHPAMRPLRWKPDLSPGA